MPGAGGGEGAVTGIAGRLPGATGWVFATSGLDASGAGSSSRSSAMPEASRSSRATLIPMRWTLDDRSCSVWSSRFAPCTMCSTCVPVGSISTASPFALVSTLPCSSSFAQISTPRRGSDSIAIVSSASLDVRSNTI